MSICVIDINFASVSVIFRLDRGIILTILILLSHYLKL